MKVLRQALVAFFAFHCALANADSAGGMANLLIIDKNSQRPLPMYVHQGRYYVAGNPGSEYRIAVVNQSRDDLLAVVSVDGVNVVSGETADPAQSGYVVDRGHRLEVDGWRKSLTHSAAFYFTRLPNSYAAKTGRAENVGVIGVALFRRKTEVPQIAESRADRTYGPQQHQAPAPDTSGSARQDREPSEKRHGERLGTGHGRIEDSPARRVTFARATPHPEELITIYYDSHSNLVARGIIRTLPPAQPEPFPGGFVSDPPRY